MCEKEELREAIMKEVNCKLVAVFLGLMVFGLIGLLGMFAFTFQ
jgi:hypothetical protein